MKIKIKFLNNLYDQYEGRIKSKNFSIVNAPGIINSLSILSFSGIKSIITGQGVFFDKGEVDIKVKNISRWIKNDILAVFTSSEILINSGFRS